MLEHKKKKKNPPTKSMAQIAQRMDENFLREQQVK